MGALESVVKMGALDFGETRKVDAVSHGNKGSGWNNPVTFEFGFATIITDT